MFYNPFIPTKKEITINDLKREYKLPLIEKKQKINDLKIKDDLSEKIKKVFSLFDIEITIEKKLSSFQFDKYYIKINDITKIKKVNNNKKSILMGLDVDKNVFLDENMKNDCFILSVEKEKKDILYLQDVIKTENKNKITINIGKTEENETYKISIDELPHLLIGGTTGSGKSVFINDLILSIVCNYSPKKVRLCLVDPKKVELNQFDKLPHLLTSIKTEVEEVNELLNWLIDEMMIRYEKLKKANCKNITEYNQNNDDKMCKIICIIDELADLMLKDKKNIETKICKLAQLSRAAGIHLIIATQRPSTDVITGLIKANFPSRICFKVASQYDSRTILQKKGAELLAGSGDCLVHLVGEFEPTRIQTPFISKNDLEMILKEVDSC